MASCRDEFAQPLYCSPQSFLGPYQATKLCKLVYPWESVSEIQSIKETIAHLSLMRTNLINCTQLVKAEDSNKTLHVLKIEFRTASCVKRTHAIEHMTATETE